MSRAALRCAVLLTAVSLGLCASDPLADAARELARKIAAAAAGKPGVLNVRVLSTITPADAERLRRALEAELPQAAREAFPIEVTLSENVLNYVWTAEIRRGGEREVVMVVVPRPQRTTPGRENEMRIERRLEIVTDEPILDIAALGDRLIALSPSAVSLYERDEGRWALRQRVMIPGSAHLPRDPRGRLLAAQEGFRAYLPGRLCSGPYADPLTVKCEPAAKWPVPFGEAAATPSRNFFTYEDLPQFYSAASAGSEGWILAGVDGRAHLWTLEMKAVGTIDGWGSDLAGVASSCGSGSQVLVTQPGEATDPDSVQAFEFANGRAAPVSPPVAFAGPVTALWTAADQGNAVAVSRNPRSGTYEAFTLSISCDR